MFQQNLLSYSSDFPHSIVLKWALILILLQLWGLPRRVFTLLKIRLGNIWNSKKLWFLGVQWGPRLGLWGVSRFLGIIVYLEWCPIIHHSGGWILRLFDLIRFTLSKCLTLPVICWLKNILQLLNYKKATHFLLLIVHLWWEGRHWWSFWYIPSNSLVSFLGLIDFNMNINICQGLKNSYVFVDVCFPNHPMHCMLRIGLQ